MAEVLKIQVEDENGNIYYLHTTADVVFCEDGKSVQEKMGEKIDKSAIIQNATTVATDKVPSAAVVKNLQDQISAQNTNTIRLWDGTLYPSSTIGNFNYATIPGDASKCTVFIVHLTIAEDKIYEVIIPHFTGTVTKNIYLGATYNAKISIDINLTSHRIGVKIDKIAGWTYNAVHLDCLYGIRGITQVI